MSVTQTYSVLHKEQSKDEINYVDSGHSVTIIITDENDRTKDQLYIDGHHVNTNNRRYKYVHHGKNRSSFSYLQHPEGPQKQLLSGNLSLSDDHTLGCGVMTFGQSKNEIKLVPCKSCCTLVGTFCLHINGRDAGVLMIHPKGLTINGKKVEDFTVSNNKVSWKGSTKEGCVSQGGFVEFSQDTSQIIKSSFVAIGPRYVNSGMIVADDILSLQKLKLMYPFNSNGDDKFQSKSMTDFFTLVRYFMPQEYVDDFFDGRPQLDGYLRDISEDDEKPGENEAYYKSLAVPYLAYSLSGLKDDHPDVAYLNYVRSDSYMKSQMHNSPVYNRHTGKIYSHYWRKEFNIGDYLDDQEYTDYTAEINQMTNDWITAITSDMDHVLDAEEIQQMVDYCKRCGQEVIDRKCYWAYALFRDLTSPTSLNQLLVELAHTSSPVDDVIREYEQYNSCMCILDDKSFFSQELTVHFDVYKLTFMVPTQIDPSKVDEMDKLAKATCKKFAEIYKGSPDEELAGAASTIESTSELEWDEIMSIIKAANAISSSTQEFIENVRKGIIDTFGIDYGPFGTLLGLGCAIGTIAYIAMGMMDWDNLTPLQQAEFIVASARGTAFLIKKGSSVLVELAPGWVENARMIFFKSRDAIIDISQRVNGAFAKWIVKNCESSRLTQGLKMIENLADEFFEKAFKNMKVFGDKIVKHFAIALAGLFAVLDSIITAIQLSQSSTPIETAVNSLFLASSILEIVSVAAEWAVSRGAMSIGGYIIGKAAMTTVASIATGLSIACAVVGFIVLMIMLNGSRDPPHPVEDFCHSEAVKSLGLYMPLKTTAEYFAVQMDDDTEETKQIGITMTTDGTNYMLVNKDGSLAISSIDYSYSTVFCVSVDVSGITDFFTKNVQDDGNEMIVHLTVNDDLSVDMQRKLDDDDGKLKQQWISECTGNVVYVDTDEEQLKSATFSVYNEAKQVYLCSDGQAITTGTTAQDWTFALEYMQPNYLQMQNIHLNTRMRNKSFYPYVAQTGSTSGRSFILDQTLPDWLVFEPKTGKIAQTTGIEPQVTESPIQVTMSAKNVYGESNSSTFTIEVEEFSRH
jgi:hypothetical protein